MADACQQEGLQAALSANADKRSSKRLAPTSQDHAASSTNRRREMQEMQEQEDIKALPNVNADVEVPSLARGSKRSAPTSQDCASVTGKRQRRGAERQGGIPDGRDCDCCGEKDTSQDPVDIAVSGISCGRSWGYPANDDGSQQGTTCIYCLVVFQSRFKHKGFGKQKLLSELGLQQETFEKFMRYVKSLIQYFIEKGGRDAMLKWADIDKRTVSVRNERKTEICEPDDDLWEYNYYLSINGDPDTNGLGHRVTEAFGKKEVVVPNAPIRKVKRSQANIVEDKRVMDNGENSFMAGQQDELLAELSDIVALPRGTGVALDMRTLQIQQQHQKSQTPSALAAEAKDNSEEEPETERPLAFGLLSKPASPAPAASPRRGSNLGQATASGAGGGGSGGGREPAKEEPKQKRPAAKSRGGKAAVASGGASPAEAKPKVEESGGKKGAIGKPRRDLELTAEKLLQEFEQSHEGSDAYFGGAWKNHSRYCSRLITDIEGKAKATKELDEYDRLSRILKQLQVIVTLCNTLKKHGFASAAFATTVDAQIQFLRMKPTADTRLPPFILLKRYESKVENATAGSTFWPLLSTSSMEVAGFSGSDACCKQARDSVKSRVLFITRSADIPAMARGFSEFFPEDCIDKFDLASSLPSDATLIVEIKEVSLIAAHGDDGKLDRERVGALGIALSSATQGAAHDITAALVNYPNGRALVRSARAWMDDAEVALGVQSSLGDIGARAVSALGSRAAGDDILQSLRAEGVSSSTFLDAMSQLTPLLDKMPEKFQKHINPSMVSVVQALESFSHVACEAFKALTSPIFLGNEDWDKWVQLTTDERVLVSAWLDVAPQLSKLPWVAEHWPRSSDDLAVLGKCKDIIDVLTMAKLEMAKPIVEHKTALALTRKISHGLEINSAFTNLVGKDLSAGVVKFESSGKLLHQSLLSKLTQEIKPRATALFKDLLGGGGKAFSIVNSGDFLSMSEEDLHVLEAWDISSEYLSELQTFSDEIGDAAIMDETFFIEAARKLIRSAALAAAFFIKNKGNDKFGIDVSADVVGILVLVVPSPILIRAFCARFTDAIVLECSIVVDVASYRVSFVRSSRASHMQS